VLTVTTLVPALVFGGVFAWAYGSIRDPEPVVTFAEPSGGPPTVAPSLTTSVLAFRRLPTVIARDLNADALGADVDPTFDLLNDRSCAAVSVGGDVVGEHNAELPVIPASNQKLPVAAAALEQLGADFRYRTEVVAAAAPIDGVVAGDLVVVGGGDPLLSSAWYPTSSLERNPVTSPTSLDELADRVVAAGVVEVTGSVVGDGSRYDDEFFAPGWGDGVAGVESGPYDALMANDARVLGEDGRVADPSEGAAREFALLLDARGVEIGGPAASGAAPAAAVEIASIESAPMSDVIAEMLLASDNNTAELVVKELGTLGGGPGTRDAGLAVVRQQLVDWDVDVSSIVLADGSGLSLDNRLTCDALIVVLQRTGFASALGQGLPVAGQTGTLSGIFVDHAVVGRLRGKTGTLNNPPFNVDPPAVKALAGFLPVEGGSAVEYVLVLNGPTIADQSEYRPVWYAFADALDTYPSAATPADLGPR
jgi:D-alanyl-D-alanine carboxypeptidase/D-alanyl-D-alanine-endopeptidase (penicillin-binding protein 4)